MGGIFGCIPWAVINTFFVDYLATDREMGIAAASVVFAIFGIGCTVGSFSGVQLGRRIHQKGNHLQPIFAAATVFVGMTLVLLLLSLEGTTKASYWLRYFIGFFAGAFSTMAGNTAKAILLNVTKADARGTAFAVLTLTDNMGKIFGPIVASWFMALFGRKVALMLTVSFWIPCGALVGLISLTVKRDEQTAQCVIKF